MVKVAGSSGWTSPDQYGQVAGDTALASGVRMAVEHKNVPVSKRLVAVNAASSLMAKILNVVVILWMYQHLLARISAAEFAVLPVVTSLMVFAPLFFSFFTGGIARYVVEAYAKGDFERVTRIVSSIFPPLAIMALVFLAGGWLFAAHIENILNIPPGMVGQARLMTGLLVTSFSLQMMALPFGVGFQVQQRFVELNLLGVARDLLRMVLLLAFLLGIGPQVLWVAVATATAETCHTAVVVWRSNHMVPELRMRRGMFEYALALRLMNFGLWTTLGQLGNVMYTNAATILLNLFGTPVDVTSYYIGATMFRQISSTVALMVQPLQPVLTAMHALGDNDRLARTVFRGGRYALWATLAVATPLSIYAWDFIVLYIGDTYARAATVLILFLLIFPFNGPTRLLSMTAMATGHVRAFFLPAFLFQLAGLGLMAGILRWTSLGATGMALALTSITIASQLFYYWPLCLRLVNRSFFAFTRQVLIPGFAPACVGAVVWIWAGFMVNPADSWINLFGCAAAGVLIYGIVIFRFCLNDSELTDLKGLYLKLKLRLGL